MARFSTGGGEPHSAADAAPPTASLDAVLAAIAPPAKPKQARKPRSRAWTLTPPDETSPWLARQKAAEDELRAWARGAKLWMPRRKSLERVGQLRLPFEEAILAGS